MYIRPYITADQAFVKLKYNETVNMSGTAVLSVRNVFRGNSAYDPNQTGVGRQPEGYDKWCAASALYNRCLVYGSKITVTAMNLSTSLATHVMVIPFAKPTALGNITFSGLMTLPYARYKLITPVGTGSGSVAKVSHYMSTGKILKKGFQFDKDYSHPYNNNPGVDAVTPEDYQWFWHVINSADSNSNPNATFWVQLTYYCKFFERNEINDEAD